MPKLLTYGNAKIVKGEKRGYLTVGLHLAPADESGKEFCRFRSPECTAACLNTSGRAAFDPRIGTARVRKSQEFTADVAAFMLKLHGELSAAVRHARKRDLILCVRLNLTSDLPWENIRYVGPDGVRHRNVMAAFPDVTFYDYTKYPVSLRRKVSAIPNYSLTFSYSGHNVGHCEDAIAQGVNVAAVFAVKRGRPLPKTARLGDGIYPVIDGDESDLRFLDTSDVNGVIVGLRAKGRAIGSDTPFILQATTN